VILSRGTIVTAEEFHSRRMLPLELWTYVFTYKAAETSSLNSTALCT